MMCSKIVETTLEVITIFAYILYTNLLRDFWWFSANVYFLNINGGRPFWDDEPHLNFNPPNSLLLLFRWAFDDSLAPQIYDRNLLSTKIHIFPSYFTHCGMQTLKTWDAHQRIWKNITFPPFPRKSTVKEGHVYETSWRLRLIGNHVRKKKLRVVSPANPWKGGARLNNV